MPGALHFTPQNWIASSQELLAMTRRGSRYLLNVIASVSEAIQRHAARLACLASRKVSLSTESFRHGLKGHAAIVEDFGDFSGGGRVILLDVSGDAREVVVCKRPTDPHQDCKMRSTFAQTSSE